MGALLALIPVKDWIYCGIIVALLAAFGWYTLHERHIGAAKITAADAHVAAIQAQHDKDVQDAAKISADKALADYKAAELQPVALPATRIVCHAASGSGVSGNAGPSGGSNAASAVPAESTVPFDPSLGILSNDRDADAQVKLLQDTIRSYQAAGVVAK